MIEVDWGNVEETLVIWKFIHRWSSDELYAAVKETKKLVESKSHKVDVIADMRQSRSAPKEIPMLFRYALDNSPANTGEIVIISTTRLWQEIFQVFVRPFIKRKNIVFVETVDEAYEHIAAVQDKRGWDETV